MKRFWTRMQWMAMGGLLLGLLPSGCEADILRIATPFLL